MNEYELLARSVVADPDDDLPRKVIADWLEENGAPAAAEFIRVSCELKEIAERMPRLAKRAEELRPSHWKLLDAEGEVLVDRWDRGFPAQVAVTWAEWLGCHDELTRTVPLRSVRLLSNPPVEVTRTGTMTEPWDAFVTADGEVLRGIGPSWAAAVANALGSRKGWERLSFQAAPNSWASTGVLSGSLRSGQVVSPFSLQSGAILTWDSPTSSLFASGYAPGMTPSSVASGAISLQSYRASVGFRVPEELLAFPGRTTDQMIRDLEQELREEDP